MRCPRSTGSERARVVREARERDDTQQRDRHAATWRRRKRRRREPANTAKRSVRKAVGKVGSACAERADGRKGGSNFRAKRPWRFVRGDKGPGQNRSGTFTLPLGSLSPCLPVNLARRGLPKAIEATTCVVREAPGARGPRVVREAPGARGRALSAKHGSETTRADREAAVRRSGWERDAARESEARESEARISRRLAGGLRATSRAR